MTQRIAGPEIEFGMNTSRAEAAAKRMGVTVDAVTAAAIREYNKVERQVEAATAKFERQAQIAGMNSRQIAAMDAALLSAAARSKGMTDATDRLAAAQARYEAASRRVGAANDNGRQGMVQLGQQLGDVGASYASTGNIAVIFAQQQNQVVYALTQMEGTAGRVGAFLANPWVAALLAAGSVVAILAAKSDEAAEKAGKHENAAKTLVDAIEDLDRATGRSNHTHEEAIRLSALAARTLYNEELQTRRLTVATLERLRAAQAATLSTAATSGNELGALAATTVMQASIVATEKLLRDQTKSIKEAEAAFRGVDVDKSLQRIEAATDKTAAATQRYNEEIGRLRRLREADRISQSEFDRAAMAATVVRNTARDADKTAAAAKREHARALREEAAAQRDLDKQHNESVAGDDALRRSYEGLTARFDPLTKAAYDYAAALAELLKVEQAGLLTGDAAMAMRLRAADAFEKARREAEKEAGRQPLVKLGVVDLPGLEKMGGRVDDILQRQREAIDELTDSMRRSGDAFADAWGRMGDGLAYGLDAMLTFHQAQQDAAEDNQRRIVEAGRDEEKLAAEQQRYARQSALNRISAYGDMTDAAQSFFERGSKGYKALAAAEKVFRAIELAMSIRAMIQDTSETVASVANAGARATADGAAAAAKAASTTPFPASLGAIAAIVAALAAVGVALSGVGGGGAKAAPTNSGTGTVLGDAAAKSESILRAVELLGQVDRVTMQHSSAMRDHLRSIDQKIGGLAALVSRPGAIDASAGIREGYSSDSLIGRLFGSKTTVVGEGLFGTGRSIGDILDNGFDAQTYADIQKTKKVLGLTTGKSLRTVYGDAGADVDRQFTLIFRSLNDAIVAAAVPLQQSTTEIADRVAHFVFDLGRVDLKGLTGEEAAEKLQAVIGAAADGMAAAAFPGMERFQQVGEGLFETLVRVANTVETVDVALGRMGANARGLSVDANMGLAALFDDVAGLQDAAAAYFDAYFSDAEKAAIRTSEMAAMFERLGTAMPDSLAAFRGLVEAQDLNSDAGRQMYATLLQIAPAFAELNEAVGGPAGDASAVLRERADLERRLLELSGDAAAIRADELSRIDPSNRALKESIWAREAEIAAAEEAARALAAVAQQRAGLERELLTLTGSVADQRAAELAQLDPALHSLKLRVWAIQDERTAMDEATRAAEANIARLEAIAGERAGLQRQVWELLGDTASLRAEELSKLDPSNRALQERIWQIEAEQAAAAEAQRQYEEQQRAAQEAVRAADQLREAWLGIADGLMEEVRRIRGLGSTGGASFSVLQGQFNAATIAARAGDQDAAKGLTGLSRELLDQAAKVATSRQELDRVQAFTAASLESTARLIGGAGVPASLLAAVGDGASWWQADATARAPSPPAAASAEVVALNEKVASLEARLMNVLITIAENTKLGAEVLSEARRAGNGQGLAVTGAGGEPIETREAA